MNQLVSIKQFHIPATQSFLPSPIKPQLYHNQKMSTHTPSFSAPRTYIHNFCLNGDYSLITYLHIFYMNWQRAQMFILHFTQFQKQQLCISNNFKCIQTKLTKVHPKTGIKTQGFILQLVFLIATLGEGEGAGVLCEFNYANL